MAKSDSYNTAPDSSMTTS